MNYIPIPKWPTTLKASCERKSLVFVVKGFIGKISPTDCMYVNYPNMPQIVLQNTYPKIFKNVFNSICLLALLRVRYYILVAFDVNCMSVIKNSILHEGVFINHVKS